MRPSQPISRESTLRDRPALFRTSIPEGAIEDLDAPAYTRCLTSLSEIRRRHAMRAADQVDAENRTFNQQFWATLASEAAGVVSGIGTELARWTSGIIGRRTPGE